MKRSLITIAAMAAMLHSTAFAQDETTVETMPKRKVFNHHVGVQMNELVRQVFNFNGNNNLTTNPYLLMYSINFAKSGWGLRVGAGPRFGSFADNDGITERKTNVTALSGRLGVEKAFRLSDRWSTGVGLDGIYNMDNNKTETTVRSFDTTETIVKSDITSYGGGAMAWLRYNVTPRIVIGTEASFYYSLGKEKETVEITSRTNVGPGPIISPITTTITKTENKLNNGVFSVPTVIYLIVSF